MKCESEYSSSLSSPLDVFLSDAPMTDEEFAEFVRIENSEIPVEKIDFSKPLYTIFEI